MKPMLARSYGPKFNRFPCFVQPKLNGVRCLYQNGVFQSRDELVWKPKVLSHIRAQLNNIDETLILDGELYRHGWRLQRINGAVAVNRSAPRDDTHLIEFHVFDCIHSGEGLDMQFSDRYLDLKNLLDCEPECPIKSVKTAFVEDKTQLDAFHTQFVAEGYEGIMLRPSGPYTPGERSTSLWKYKHWEDEEFLCIGVTQGEGKANIGIGSLTLVTNKDCEVEFQCGTGFTDEERMELAQNPPVWQLVKVKFNSKTADGIPVPCVFLSVIP